MTWDAAMFAVVVVLGAVLTAVSVQSLVRRNGGDTAARAASAATYASMEGTLHQMSQRLGELEDARERDHETIITLSARIKALEDGVTVLIRQIRNAGLEPEWQPEDTIMVATPVNLATLEDRLKKAFNIDELNDLAERVGIPAEDIPGDTLPRRVHELVAAAQRRGLIGNLILSARELRPRNRW